MRKPTVEESIEIYKVYEIKGRWANVKDLFYGKTMQVPNIIWLSLGIALEALLIITFNAPH